MVGYQEIRHVPIEQPTRFDLVVNLQDGEADGADDPPNVLARADNVIK